MKRRLVVSLVGLAISFALPTFAQQTNKPEPQLAAQTQAPEFPSRAAAG
jgi:hypothetical protein